MPSAEAPQETEGAAGLASDVWASNDRASALVRLGLSLLESTAMPDVPRALACFDRALAVRLALPVDDSPILRYDLGGVWLNRADALLRTAPPRVDEAVRSFDAAIELLERLPHEGDPRFSRRLAIAHQNRGLAHRSRNPAATASAVMDFVRAIDVLERDTCAALIDRDPLMATVWVNLADLQVDEETTDAWRRAVQSADQARRLIAGRERSDLAASAVGLKARHVCCRALARCLTTAAEAAATANIPSDLDDDVHAATDAAEEGLDLARFWETRGVTRHREVSHDLFRFGLQVYSAFQPQFVAEFAFDYLCGPKHLKACAGDPALRTASQQAIVTASARASAGVRPDGATRRR
ncbi:MAG: hypothetical protein AB7O32_12335 [Vicinamibacterales bacterium]